MFKVEQQLVNCKVRRLLQIAAAVPQMVLEVLGHRKRPTHLALVLELVRQHVVQLAHRVVCGQVQLRHAQHTNEEGHQRVRLRDQALEVLVLVEVLKVEATRVNVRECCVPHKGGAVFAFHDGWWVVAV